MKSVVLMMLVVVLAIFANLLPAAEHLEDRTAKAAKKAANQRLGRHVADFLKGFLPKTGK